MIENTAKREPALHLLGALSEGSDGYIGGMEAAGQRQLVHSDQVPTEGSDALAELGFTLGDVVAGDPLFRHVTLPEDWTKQGTDHAMHSQILDPLGRKRVGIFYKAAFYDRRADCHVIGLHAYLWDVAAGRAPLLLDDEWATKDSVVAMLRKMISQETERINEWTERLVGQEFIDRHTATRASYQLVLDSLATS